jgi:hypothetical protein
VIIALASLVQKRFTAFIVERGTPGFNAGKKENKLECVPVKLVK